MPRLVNHCDSALTQNQVLLPDVSFAGLENYRGRPLCMTNQDDVIQLPPSLKDGWDWIRAHYDRVGLGHTESVIWDSSFAQALEFPDHELSVFMFTPEVHAVRPDARRLAAVRLGNSKNKFIGLCNTLGVPAPRTVCYEAGSGFSLPDLPFPLYLKADVSVSGLGVVRCESEEVLRKHLKWVGNGAFQLQEELTVTTFLNVQYEAGEQSLRAVATTEQILDGNAHNGNVFPSRFEAYPAVDSLAQALWTTGMRGYYGFDVAITDHGPFAIECNPRFNGSTYPTIAAQRLGIPSWLATNVKVRTRSFENFSLGPLEYNRRTGEGIVIINWGAILGGKLGVLIAGPDRNAQQRLLQEAQAL